MSTPDPADLAGLGPPARRFVRDELAAGNQVLQVIAPPPGVCASRCVLMSKPLCTGDGPGPRTFGELAPGVPEVVVIGADAYPHDASSLPDEADAVTPREAAEDSAGTDPTADARRTASGTSLRRSPPARPGESPLVARFRASQVIDLEAWRDGIGYDLAAINEADAAERAAMLDLLRQGRRDDWRDVEALAALAARGEDRAAPLLRQCLQEGSHAVRMAVLRHAPQLVAPAEREQALVDALAGSRLFEGLSECLDEVAHDPTPRVIAALWQAARQREREVSVHCAALLAYLHGLADSPFDWAQRPFFLRCGSDDPAERARALTELRARVMAAGGPLPPLD